MSRLLGLDVGDRRIGVAVTDPERLLALPVNTIEAKDAEAAVQSIVDLVASYEVSAIVVGLPTLLSGELGEQARKVQEFAHLLSQRISVPIEWWDERLSTVSAEKMLRGAGAKKTRRDASRDALAAALVLQDYLDAQRMKQA